MSNILDNILPSKFVDGTNCGNCKFHQKNSDNSPIPLDPHLGVIPENKEDLERAKQGDLVTLPGEPKTVQVLWCNHPRMQMRVTSHNCCAYWDNKGCIRSFGKQEVGVEKPYK